MLCKWTNPWTKVCSVPVAHITKLILIISHQSANIFYNNFFITELWICITIPLSAKISWNIMEYVMCHELNDPVCIFWSLVFFNESGTNSLCFLTNLSRYINIQWCVSQTQHNFTMFIIVLGQHVSSLIESSLGPSKIQILTLKCLKCKCM